MDGADGKERHECPADDALNEAEAVAQTGQYPRWRRRLDTVCQVGSVGHGSHVRTGARIAHLSSLTHLSPTFGLRMGRPDRSYLFTSDH
jgi:hypothetical protein